MFILFPKQRISSLVAFVLLLCIVLLLFRLSSVPVLLRITFGIVIIFFVGLIYRILCLRRLFVVSNKVLSVHSYFKHKRYNCEDIGKIVIKRGGWAYQMLDLRLVRITVVSGKEDILVFPDFTIKDFDKILLSIMSSASSKQL